MIKKISPNPLKLIKYFKSINYNLIYNDKAINRYKKDNFEISSNKTNNLERLKKSILNIKNCSLKKSATNIMSAVSSTTVGCGVSKGLPIIKTLLYDGIISPLA